MLLLLCPLVSNAQVNIYNEQGKVLCNSHNERCNVTTANRLTDVAESHVYYVDSDNYVGYKLLTDHPLWVATGKAENIADLLKKFDYNRYLHSFELYYDLKSMVNNKLLTEQYAESTLGKPDKKSKNAGDDVWQYEKLELFVVFRGGVAVRYYTGM